MFDQLFERPGDRRNKRGLNPLQRRVARIVAGVVVLAVGYLVAVAVAGSDDSGLSEAGRATLLELCIAESTDGAVGPDPSVTESCEAGNDAWEDLMEECSISEEGVIAATQALADGDQGQLMVLTIEESECGGQLPPSMVEQLGSGSP